MILDIDEWSSEAEKEKAALLCHKEIDTRPPELVYGSLLDDTLASQIESSKRLLEKLCGALSTKLNSPDDIQRFLESLAPVRVGHAESALLADRVVALAHEIVELKAQLFVAEKDRNRCHKKLAALADGLPIRPSSSAPSSSSSATTAAAAGEATPGASEGAIQSSPSVTHTVTGAGTGAPSSSSSTLPLSSLAPPGVGSLDREDTSERRDLLQLLERQVRECEDARALLETKLNDSIAAAAAAAAAAAGGSGAGGGLGEKQAALLAQSEAKAQARVKALTAEVGLALFLNPACMNRNSFTLSDWL